MSFHSLTLLYILTYKLNSSLSLIEMWRRVPYSFLLLFIAIPKWVYELLLNLHYETEWTKERICALYYLSCSVSQFSHSVAILCDPMDCSMPGLPVHHQLQELLAQTHVHRVGRCHPTISPSVVPFSSCLQSFPASGSFQMSQLFTSGGQRIGVSASTSVLPINIQYWFPLRLTGLISLQAKGLSSVFSNTTVQKHQLFSTQLSLLSNFHIHTWPLEKP